jgi:hypothetical protein
MPRARRIAVVLVVRPVAELRVGSHGLLIKGRSQTITMPSKLTDPTGGPEKSPVTKLKEHPMRRDRHTPPTPSSVRGLATRRGYLFAADQRSTRMFKLISLVGRAAPMLSRDGKHRYSWKLADADAWLRKQPLLSDR